MQSLIAKTVGNASFWVLILGFLAPILQAKLGVQLDTSAIAAEMAAVASFILGHHYLEAQSAGASPAPAPPTQDKVSITLADGTKVTGRADNPPHA